MTRQSPPVFGATDRALGALTVLNVVYGAGILLLLAASLARPAFVFTALAGRPADGAGGAIRAMRLLMLVGLAAVPVVHVGLARLRAMLATVRAGDPFVAENARRLDAVAAAVLGLELLHLLVGAVVRSDALAALGIRLDWEISVTPWVAAPLLFVLARVFEHGARMRADLVGTV